VTLDEKQRLLAKELAPLPDAPARLAWLIERARRRPMLPVELRLDAHLVEGCLSKLWFVPEFRDGRCWFRSESDSLVVKSVAGLLCDFYSGHTPAEILERPPVFLSSVRIPYYLTPNRRSTMGRVWEKIRGFAENHIRPLAGIAGRA
jgi:cysteine desulfuration protein SufE